MNGIAQKLFQERSQKNLVEDPKKISKWPLLEKMLAAKCLGYVDLSLAQQLLRQEAPSEAAAALICHLSMAARRGHVCVKIEQGSLIPSLEEIWVDDEPGLKKTASTADFYHLSQLVLEGSKMELPSLICQGNQTLNTIHAPLVKNNRSFYLQRNWYLESVFLTGFSQTFMGTHPLKPIDLSVIESQVKRLIAAGNLLKEQAEAILIASQSPLTLITGGPGTGKTYTAGILLRTLWEALNHEEQANFTIALAAPTGKAAANLESSLQTALKDVDGFPLIKAQTLHQLLGIKKSMYGQDLSPLSADLILVDESSMIDIKLMGQLFSAIKPGARLILLGDKHQLSSVEAGSLFADLIEYFRSQMINTVTELKICMRSELKSIIDLAGQIKIGNAAGALTLLESEAAGIRIVKFHDEWSVSEQQKRLLNEVIPYFPIFKTLPEDLSSVVKGFNNFRILTPLRKGPFGADTINAMIFQALIGKNEQKNGFIAPIMVMQNDYRLGLFNGEVGLIVKEKEKEFALFASREPGQEFRQIPALLMPRYEYAYCLSVHKSQGSEFDHVVLLLSEGTQTFGREALYTGVTRAKRRLEIWSKPSIVSEMIKMTGTRQSGIVERLSQYTH
jgi:exodeoxyribonuclease V alpha subunit